MNRSDIAFAIFQELRAATPTEVTDCELLAFTKILITDFKDELQYGYEDTEESDGDIQEIDIMFSEYQHEILWDERKLLCDSYLDRFDNHFLTARYEERITQQSCL
jgi:hypothetical protein